jgi:hypothetical protein
MRMTKLGVIVASLALTAGTASVLAAGPADAATATKAKLTINGKHKAKAEYGSLVGFLDSGVTGSDGGTPTGTVTLQAKMPGKGWKSVKSNSDVSFTDFNEYGHKAKGNVEYRVRYSGDGTYSATTSNVVKVTTLWKVKDTSACPSGHCHISGKLTPKAKHKKLVVQVKTGHWKTFKVLHTSATSKYKVGVSTIGGKPTHYRLLIPGTKTLVGRKIPYLVHRV